MSVPNEGSSPGNNKKQKRHDKETSNKEVPTQAEFEAAIARLVASTESTILNSTSYDCDCPTRPDPLPRCRCTSGCSCDCGCSREEQVNLASGYAEPELAFDGLAINPAGSLLSRRQYLAEPFLTQFVNPDGSACRAFIEMTPGILGGNVYHYDIPDEHYAPCYDCKAILTCIPTTPDPDPEDPNPQPTFFDYDLKEPDGTTYRFHEDGYLVYRIDQNGDKTTYHRDHSIANHPTTQIRRVYNRDGQDYEEVQVIQYGMVAGESRPQSITRRRRETDAAGNNPWQNLSKVDLDYGSGSTIRRVRQRSYRGNGWSPYRNTMYRFDASNRIKLIIEPDAYARAGGGNVPLGMSDAQLGQYASTEFKYDANGRVKSVSTLGGTVTKTIAYTENQDSGVDADPHNNWFLKAVMSSPDGSSLTVLGNLMGRDVVKHDSAANIDQVTYYQFDGDGRQIAEHTPNSIDWSSGLPYNTNTNSLSVKILPDSGLIRLLTYYDETNASGAAECYLFQELSKEGSNGVPIVETETKYLRRTIYVNGIEDPVTVFHPSEVKKFHETGSTSTSYSYEFYQGKHQVKKRTMHSPSVPANQNGGTSIPSQTVVENFDTWGRLTSMTEPNVVPSTYEYEPLTNSRIKSSRIVNGQSQDSESSVDFRGRTTETLGPVHMVDGQPNRHATWTVYKSEHETWTAQGFVDGAGNKTLVNPVQIVRESSDGKTIDTISAARGLNSESPGQLSSSDSFPQTTWTAWSSEHLDNVGRAIESRVYHDIPSSGNGAVGTNYTRSTYSYNNRGQLEQTVSPAGIVSKTLYNGLNQPVSQWIGANVANLVKVSSKLYDSLGRLAESEEMQDADGSNARRAVYHYDWKGRVERSVQIGLEDNLVQASEFDRQGRVVAQETRSEASDGTQTLISRVESLYNNRGQVYQTTRFGVDQDTGALTSETIVSSQTYDSAGRLKKQISPGGTEFVVYSYDSLGRQTSQTNALAFSVSTTYNEIGQVVLTKDQLQRSTQHIYDRAGRKIKTINPLGEASGTPEFDKAGRVTANVDPLLNRTEFVFDDAGKQTEIIDPELKSVTQDYDLFGRLKSTTNQLLKTTQYFYDSLGRQNKVVDPLLRTIEQVFDLAGNVVKEIDAKSEETVYSYDSFGRRYKTVDRLNHPTVYSFDRAGRQKSITDAESSVTKYGYDSFGRMAMTQHADHVVGTQPGDADYGIVAMEYDNLGRMKVRTDQKGNTVTLVYDVGGRLMGRQYRTRLAGPTGTISDQDTFTYEDTGQVKTATSGRYGNSVTFDYDLVGRKIEEVLTIGSDSFTVGTDYDELSRVDEITYPNNKKVERQYNSRGLLEQVKYDGSIVDTRLYDDVGRLETSTYGNGVVTQFGYLDDNRVQSIATTNNGTQKVGTYSYAYDLNGNKTAETISGGGVSNDFGFSTGQSGYDADDRLVGWNRSDGDRDHSWNLSPVGDWNSLTESSSSGAPTTTSYSHSDSHETIAIDNASIGYDANGNRLTANNGTDIYDWDFDNKLACVGDHSFEFDALGRRVAISVAGATSILVCNDQQLIAVYSLGSGTSQPPGGMPPGPPMPPVATLEKVFVFGSYIDEPLMMLSGSDKYYFSRNQQYSITALTNVGGQVAERYAYDAYGKTQILSGSGTVLADSSVGNPFMFTGRYNHPMLDLMYFRARMYDTVTGNFISQDPLGFVDGMSLYRGYFVPSGVDPIGLCEVYSWSAKFDGKPDAEEQKALDLYWATVKRRIEFPTPNIASFGAHHFAKDNKKNVAASVGAFAVSFKVCEDKGPCSVKIAEDRLKSQWRIWYPEKNEGWWTTEHKPVDLGEMQPSGNTVPMKFKRDPIECGCLKPARIIVVDVPFIQNQVSGAQIKPADVVVLGLDIYQISAEMNIVIGGGQVDLVFQLTPDADEGVFPIGNRQLKKTTFAAGLLPSSTLPNGPKLPLFARTTAPRGK